MIREPAARQLAHTLLDPFGEIVNDSLIRTAARLIQTQVDMDELLQEIERGERVKILTGEEA